MTRLSILDLVPVAEGRTLSAALAESAEAARHAEMLGFHRYWVAEHHLMEGIGGAATAVVLAHIGHVTSSIRIGAGGIMLPNHSPLVIAEQFGTLDALFPGRIDLGLGRAPGADMRVAQALRRDLRRAAEEFPRDIMELRAHFAGEPDLGLIASPGRGAQPEMWILGSSLYGAQLAAALGMPYAFASHFAPDALFEALDVYRSTFRPSPLLDRPHVMVAMHAFAADTAEEARLAASSTEQGFVALRTGQPGKVRPPVENYRATLAPHIAATLDHVMRYCAIGTGEEVAAEIRHFAAITRADEVILAGGAYDLRARLRSMELVKRFIDAEMPATRDPALTA